jgi:hypothetical protein
MMCALMAAGCTQQNSTPLRVKVQGSALYVEQDQGIGTADLMEVAEDVLANMYFTIDKADTDSGLIRTRPLSGAQFFEFWRSDNAGTDNALAANLHTIRRTVTLDISQEGQELRIGCNVQAQRLSLPERQVSSSTTRVYGMFSQSSQSLQKLKLNPEQKKEMAWIDLDRDSRLEAEILKRIETGIVRLSNHQSQMTENQT